MADESNLQFSLDLDTSSFVEGAQGALETIQSLGDEENIAGLLGGFAELGIALGAVGVAVFAFKEALDLTVEGEEIERIENQFNTLATQAGVNGDQLKEGMEKAAGGLMTTTDLLQAANKALVTMGSSAQQLPQLLELARKAGMVMGGDLQTNFDNLTRAIEMGNTRLLKHMGINIDVDAAEKKYAESIGKTVGVLSESGKQHAILNAVLEQAGKQYEGINLDQDRTVDTMTRLKISLKEIGETITVVFSNTLGPYVTKAVGWFKELADSAKNFTLVHFGNDVQKASAQIEILKGKINETKQSIDSLQKHEGIMAKILPDSVTEGAIEKNKEQLKNLESQLASLESKQKEAHKADIDGTNASIIASQNAARSKDVDAQKETALQKKAAEEVTKIQAQQVKFQEQDIQSLAQIDALIDANENQRKKQHYDTLSKYAQEYGKKSEEYAKVAAAENERYRLQEIVEARKQRDTEIKYLQEYQSESETVGDAIVRQARVDSEQMGDDLTNASKQGSAVMKSLENAGTSAFEALGKAAATNSKNAAAAMGSALLGALGQFATSQGSVVVAKGVADSVMLNPIGPAEIVAGGALVALGSAISALSGSSSSSPSVSASTPSTGSAGVGTASATTTGTTSAASQAQQTPQRSVTVNISGHYLNTQASQRTLMEIMRNEVDATGFAYNSIGTR